VTRVAAPLAYSETSRDRRLINKQEEQELSSLMLNETMILLQCIKLTKPMCLNNFTCAF